MTHRRTYRPQIAQIPADSLRAGTCDTRDPRSPMNPLTGIWSTFATVPGYRDASPNGERHHPAAIVHCSLYIVHWSCFGSRYYSSDLSIWLSVDPMSDKYPSLSPYVYCADNPVKLVDPNGEDWYESEDGKTLEFIYGESAQREGYTNIGSHLTQEYRDRVKNGEYSTVSMSANFGNSDFVAQKDGRCCEAANQMCINRGGKRTFYGNELSLVTPGDNGKAGSSGIPKNFSYGIEKLCSSLENGIPVVAGVDYASGSNNPIRNHGDGMTDHYVAIIGVTLYFSKDSSTGETFISGGNLRYANPGNNLSSDGLNPNNLFTINVSKNYRVERYVNNGVCFTVTNLRVK